MISHVCQCCGFRFSEKIRGTNRDHSKNNDYCLLCFRDGEFTDNRITIQGMEKRLLNMAKRNDEISLEEACQIISILPDLKRWKMSRIL